MTNNKPKKPPTSRIIVVLPYHLEPGSATRIWHVAQIFLDNLVYQMHQKSLGELVGHSLKTGKRDCRAILTSILLIYSFIYFIYFYFLGGWGWGWGLLTKIIMGMVFPHHLFTVKNLWTHSYCLCKYAIDTYFSHKIPHIKSFSFLEISAVGL